MIILDRYVLVKMAVWFGEIILHVFAEKIHVMSVFQIGFAHLGHVLDVIV